MFNLGSLQLLIHHCIPFSCTCIFSRPRIHEDLNVDYWSAHWHPQSHMGHPKYPSPTPQGPTTPQHPRVPRDPPSRPTLSPGTLLPSLRDPNGTPHKSPRTPHFCFIEDCRILAPTYLLIMTCYCSQSDTFIYLK